MTRQRQEIVLWVLVLLVLPATMILLATRPEGRLRTVAGVLFLAAPALVAAVLLWIAGPRRPPLRGAVLILLAVVGIGLGGALLGRGSFYPSMMFLMLWFTGGGALAVGLLLFLCHRLGAAESFLRVARLCFVVAALACAVGATAFLGGGVVERWDVQQAKTWVEELAHLVEEVRQETGRYPESITALVERVGEPPRLVAGEGQLGYVATEQEFRLEFPDPSEMFFGGYVYTGPEGVWSYWTD